MTFHKVGSTGRGEQKKVRINGHKNIFSLTECEKELAEFIIDEDERGENAIKSIQNPHGDSGTKNSSKKGGGLPSTPRKEPVWTSTKQSMSYLTVRGIESDLSRQETEWPKEIMIQLISNAWDWLQDNYPDGTKETRKIAVRIKISSIPDGDAKRIVIRIAVQNSNVDNLPVFDELEQIFDFTKFHSTKRNHHRMVSGALGDFLKRGLGMGYASWTEDYDRERKDSAIAADKQWLVPVIIRHNGDEDEIFLHVEWDKQEYRPIISLSSVYDAPKFTEVEITLPLDSILRKNSNRGISHILNDMKNYFYRNKIGKTNTEFTFEIEHEEGKSH